jgi:hypothetical protein
MTRREARENSAIFRSYGELFPGKDHTTRKPDRTKARTSSPCSSTEQERQGLEVGQLRF